MSNKIDTEALKGSVDILEVIENYIEVNDNGKAICPFHEEATPSLTINQGEQLFHCFGCGASGDVISFVQDFNKVSFEEACKTISGGDYTNYTQEGKAALIKKQPKTPPMTRQEVLDHIKDTGYSSGDYRGINDEYSKFFGHLTKVDKEGVILARHYPETRDGVVTGYKIRKHPKIFSHGNIGATGMASDLSGQVKFTTGGKYLLIVGGEEDKVAAYEMLAEAQKARGQGEYLPIPVVSPTTGEPSAHKQIAAQYEFCDMYENIIIGMDNDEAGIAAAKRIADVLPKEKVKIALWSQKDPNKMLQLNMGKQFVRDFYAAKPVIKDKIQTSHNLADSIRETLTAPRITLPEYMGVMQANMGGGVRQGAIVNIIGQTSVGKSSHINGLFYHLIFNSPEKPAVISLEATAAEYALDMLAIHLEKNLVRMGGEEAADYLDTPEVKERSETLWMDEGGEERFVILDERDGDIKVLERHMERMASQYGCKVFIIDVLTDILRGSSSELQEDHMAFQKRFVKEGNTIFNVLHTRKLQTDGEGKTRPLTEYDALGSSTFVQSAAINILIERDKVSDDDIEKNTTRVSMPKCRGGVTGDCGSWYYDPATRKVYDKSDYFG